MIFHAAPDTAYVNHFFPAWIYNMIQIHSGETSGPRDSVAARERSTCSKSREKRALPKSPQAFEVAEDRTSRLVNFVFSCQTGLKLGRCARERSTCSKSFSLVKLVFRVLASVYWSTLLFGEAIMETSVAFLNFEFDHVNETFPTVPSHETICLVFSM